MGCQYKEFSVLLLQNHNKQSMSSLRRTKRVQTQASLTSTRLHNNSQRLHSQPNPTSTITSNLSSSLMGRTNENKHKNTLSSTFQEPHLIRIALSSHLQKSCRNKEENKKEENNQKYEIMKVIAQGSASCVFLAHAKDNKTFAIKQVLTSRTKPNRELSLLKTIKHPNIIRLEDYYIKVDREKCLLHIVMEYFHNTLSSLIKKRAIHRKLVPVLAYQILNGLAYLSHLQIMHRDLTPQNILVDVKTNKLVLADFGSAKYMKSYQQSLSYVCTRTYRAPQLLFGAIQYSTQVDMWSFGCILVQMVTGLPFCQGKTSIEQILELIKKLGTPTQSQMVTMNPQFILSEFEILPKIKGKALKDILNIRDPVFLDLLEKILVYDPAKRLTPESAMTHSFFDCIKDEKYLQQMGISWNLFAQEERSETRSISISPESPESPLKPRSLRVKIEEETTDPKESSLTFLPLKSINLKRRLF